MLLINGETIAKLARPTTADQCYQGSTTLEAGETLEVKNSGDLLEITCPVGKAWFVRIRVDITESDA